MIDWQRVMWNLRRECGPLTKVARLANADPQHLQRLARGEVYEPRFSLALRLLDLHLDYVPDHNNLME